MPCAIDHVAARAAAEHQRFELTTGIQQALQGGAQATKLVSLANQLGETAKAGHRDRGYAITELAHIMQHYTMPADVRAQLQVLHDALAKKAPLQRPIPGKEG